MMSGGRRMDIEAIRKKAFYAIRPLKNVEPTSCAVGGHRTKAGSRLPEYYLVYFLLVDLLGFDYVGKDEKVAWAIPVDLRGQLLSIETSEIWLRCFLLEWQSRRAGGW